MQPLNLLDYCFVILKIQNILCAFNKIIPLKDITDQNYIPIVNKRMTVSVVQVWAKGLTTSSVLFFLLIIKTAVV